MKLLTISAAGLVVALIATVVVAFFALNGEEHECESHGGHYVTTVTYGFRYTPGTTKYEYGPIYSSECK
jgi:hypothetical protein